MLGIRGIRSYPSYHFALRDRLLIRPPEACHQCVTGGLPAQIGAVLGVRLDARNYQMCARVVSGSGMVGRVNRR